MHGSALVTCKKLMALVRSVFSHCQEFHPPPRVQLRWRLFPGTYLCPVRRQESVSADKAETSWEETDTQG